MGRMSPNISCMQNEGASGDIDENKGEEKLDSSFRIGARGAGPLGSFWLRTPYSSLLHFKNEGASGDVDENKGEEKLDSGVRCGEGGAGL